MGIASTDPNTGKPTYNDISHTQTDLQAAADFAEKGLGEHVATSGALPANGGLAGRHIWVDAENCDYVWNGSVWVALPAVPLTANISTFGAGVTPLTGPHVPRLRLVGGRVTVAGGVSVTSFANLFTVDVPFRPITDGQFAGAILTSKGGFIGYTIGSNGLLSLQSGNGYIVGSGTAGAASLANLGWMRD